MAHADYELLPSEDCKWRDWIVPLACAEVTLAEALDSAKHLAAAPHDIPLIVRLCENPSFEVPGFGFDGAVDLYDHDCIHVLLGRGLLSKDEAFVIGFTMGSTNRVSTTQEKLYSWASRFLYPKPYNFDAEDIHIFKDAVRLGFISDCRSLNRLEFRSMSKQKLADVRSTIGLETDLLQAYYRIEARRYPKAKASQRLVPKS